MIAAPFVASCTRFICILGQFINNRNGNQCSHKIDSNFFHPWVRSLACCGLGDSQELLAANDGTFRVHSGRP